MSQEDLGPLNPSQKTGTEHFYTNAGQQDFDLLAFWQWSSSNLLDNTVRGILAEFIVAKALGISTHSNRQVWLPWDLETDQGVRIEVKSAAFLQSWGQKRLSIIQFLVPKRRGFDEATSQLELTAHRQAHVYVFALLAHEDKTTVDPLNLDQWRFFVVPTRWLDDRTRSQHSITLRSLQRLAGEPILFHELAKAVERVVAVQGRE